MKRRGNNEGTIHKRKDGRYEGKLVVGYKDNGKPIRKSVYARTRAEVDRKLSQMKALLYSGNLTDSEGVSLGDYLDEWLRLRKRSRAIAETTHEAYGYALAKMMPIRHLRLDKVTPLRIEQVYADMREAGLSARTVEITHTTLFSAFEDAVRWGKLPGNVMTRVRRPRPSKPEIQIWSTNEVRTFLAAIGDHRLFALFYTAIFTGMRRAELIGLRWNDVAWAPNGQGAVIHVRRNVVSTRDGRRIVKKPKTIASLRRIPVADDVAIVLKVHKASQDRERCTMARAWGDEGIAFASTTGEYLDPRNLSRALRRLLDPLDVTPVGLHAFRHTHASILIRNGVDAKTVSDRLGHRDVAFTLDRYQHLFEEQRTAAAIGFDDLLGSQAPTKFRPAADTPEAPRESVVERVRN